MPASASTKIPPVSIPVPLAKKAGRILVVDDEPPICRYIEQALRAGGYEDLIFSGNGSHVPSLALSERPHLIIMDVMMPGGNGMRALRSLKSTAATAGIPVIITSGFNVPTQDDCQPHRADHVLAKPFTVEQLLKAVGQLLKA